MLIKRESSTIHLLEMQQLPEVRLILGPGIWLFKFMFLFIWPCRPKNWKMQLNCFNLIHRNPIINNDNLFLWCSNERN